MAPLVLCGVSLLVLIAQEAQISAFGAVRLPNGVLDQRSGQPGVESILRQAERSIEIGDLDQALFECKQALRLNPSSARAYYLVGMIHLDRGDDEQAKAALRKSLALDPRFVPAHVDLGKLYFRSHDWRAADREFRVAADLGDPSGAAEFGYGLALVREGRVSEAASHLAAAARADPNNSEKLFTLITAELELHEFVKARQYSGTLESISANNPAVLYQLGSVLVQHRLLDDGVRALMRSAALLATQHDAPPHTGLSQSSVALEIGDVLFQQHDYKAALAWLEKFDARAALPKDRARALDLQGRASVGLGRILDGREKLRKAMATDPSKVEYVLHFAWAEFNAGDIAGAIRAISSAKARWPQATEPSFLLAVLEREQSGVRSRIPLRADWHLIGEGVVCCPCSVPCPCRSNAPPTHEHCENTGVFHVERGNYGNIRLDGLTVAGIDSVMNRENIPSSVYVNSSATDEQLVGLERVFQSFQPLDAFMLLSVTRIPLQLASQDNMNYEINVPGVMQIKVRRELDDHHRPLLETAALDYFSNRLEYGRNLVYKVWDAQGRLRWDYSGRQANFRSFNLDATDYSEQRMLIQFADWSGSFNRRQLELIHRLKLPMLSRYPKSGINARRINGDHEATRDRETAWHCSEARGAARASP